MKLGIVIVLFNPDAQHVYRIVETFLQSGVPVSIIDNSPEPIGLDVKDKCHYLHYPQNVGIAHAQNEGLRELFSNGCHRVMLLDQDSTVTPNDLFELSDQFTQISYSSPIAAIGPSILCEFSNTLSSPMIQREYSQGKSIKQVRQIIASGMLISSEAFKTVGEKEAALFIDGVDHEWCWRAAKKGLNVYKSESVVMRHRQGDDRVRVFGVNFKQGAPVRLYYQFRNIITLSRRDYVPVYWKLRNLLAIPVRYIVNRFVFDSGSERTHYMHQGLKDGVAKNYGQLRKE